MSENSHPSSIYSSTLRQYLPPSSTWHSLYTFHLNFVLKDEDGDRQPNIATTPLISEPPLPFFQIYTHQTQTYLQIRVICLCQKPHPRHLHSSKVFIDTEDPVIPPLPNVGHNSGLLIFSHSLLEEIGFSPAPPNQPTDKLTNQQHP